MDVSQVRLYSVGYVAENKALGSRSILVLPIEALQFIDGEVKSHVTDVETQGIDGGGKTYSIKVAMDNALQAEWLPLGSTNRASAPDVRRGERVFLWHVGETDRYYWTSTGMDDRLRKLETVIYTFSGTADEGKDGNAPENAYFLEVSTHKGLVTFHTSKANGEPYGYTFQFNTREGVVTLADDVGNYVELDSAVTRIRLENTLGSWFELDRKHIRGYAPDSVSLKAVRDILVEAGRDFQLTAGNNISQRAGNRAVLEGGSSATLKSGGVSLQVTPNGISGTG